MFLKPDAKTLSLKRLASDFGIDVLSLPISVFNSDQMGGTPAYIDSSGIHIARSVVDTEPENIHVYLGHEIMHCVIHNDEETGMFNSMLVNIAEDYKINQFLLEVLGYDVRKVKIRGLLLAKKYGKMSVAAVCQCVSDGDHRALTPCKTKWSYHPAVFEQAVRLRAKFEKHFKYLGAKPTDFFHVDAMDSHEYHLNAGSSVSKLEMSNLMGININRVMHGLWAHAYLDTAVAVEPVSDQLLSSQSLVWGLPGDKLRETTKGKIDVALLTAVNYIERVDLDALHLRTKRGAVADTVSRLKYDIKHFRKLKLTTAEVTNKRTKLADAEKRLAVLVATKPLPDLMNSRQVRMLEAPKKGVGVQRQCLATSQLLDLGATYRSEVKLPNFDRSDEIIKRLRRLGSSAMQKAESTAELAKSLEREFGPLLGKCDDGTTPRDGRGEGEEDESTPNAGPGKGRGSEQAVFRTRLEALQAIGGLQSKLQDILAKMHEIETMLSRRHSLKPSEAGHEDVLLGYGNDLGRIVSSELALLTSEKTKLAFFAKYAEHSLLQVNPTEKRRYPVAFCIDCSGSMQGDFYTTAVGFVLAMSKLLHKDKRGSVFVMFASSVDGVLMVRPDEPFDGMKLIAMLSCPSFGGTDFGPAFSRAYDVKEAEKWKSMATMLVSDGYGSISGLDELRARRSATDRWVGVIVSSGNPKIEGLDETWNVTKDGMLTQLVARGASLL